MTPPPTDKLEEETRIEIDEKLEAAGWVIQDYKQINLVAGDYGVHGVAVREHPTDTGPADYMLFIAGKACGIIEAKREGTNLGQVAEQSARYATSNTKHIERWVPDDQALPFLYESTNHEIRFRDERDPKPRSRYLFHFHRPKTLKYWLEEGDTFRSRLQHLLELNTTGLRDCQIDAVKGIEASLQQANPRALLQMATGSGKTFAAVTEIYRLAKFAKAKRILFLVDRGNLGRQALKEFKQYTVPDDGRKFTELYNAHILGQADIGDEIKVTISTIQRLYSKLSNNEIDEEVDEHSGYETDANWLDVQGSTNVAGGRTPGATNQRVLEVKYNASIPIEAFDIVIIDECHRSIYNLWRQVLEYFDAFLIGLTATPTKKTIGFFNQNMVSEYTHEDAVIDKVNVGYDIYSIRTKKSVKGDKIEAGTTVPIRDKVTKEQRLEELDKAEEYTGQQIDRSVIVPNQIRTIIQTFKDRVFKDIFPERSGEWLPKTLIFAKDDDHAERIVDTVREVFAEGNEFCKKITYKAGKQKNNENNNQRKEKVEDIIAAFRTNPQLRVAVTVDMIATGTDIKPLEIVMFMRDVKSPAYYEQMKGRGTRVLSEDELRKVTPDAKTKTRFVLIDCVGVTESDKTESKSLESKLGVSTEKLMLQIAKGDRHSDSLRSLGNRMLRLDMKLDEHQRKRINNLIKEQDLPLPQGEGGGEGFLAPTTLIAIASNLIHGTKEDTLVKAAQDATGTNEVNEDQIQQAFKTKADLLMHAFHNPDLRELVEALRKDTEQIIDESADELLHDKLGYSEETANKLFTNWQQFIKDHKNELDAIQLIYQQPYQKRHLSYDMINQLVEEIEQPPYHIAPAEVWKAYEQLKKAKVKGAAPESKLPILISLIRLATGVTDVLEPFTELVNNRFENWVKQQNSIKAPSPLAGEGGDEGEVTMSEGTSGVERFTSDQLVWLNKIKDQIAQNAEMTEDDFEYTPFNQEGGLLKARELFGKDLQPIIDELNGFLIA